MIKFHYDIVQGSQEWLDLRKGKVTCSNALAVMNKGVKACLLANEQAANRLTPNGNAYAERGHVIEHEYKEEFNKSLVAQGLELVECGFIENDKYPNAGYSPDGLVMVKGADDIASFAEFKAYNDITKDKHTNAVKLPCKHRNACKSELGIPPECIAQCNMAMLLTETEYMYLFLCNPDYKTTNAYIKRLVEQANNGDTNAAKMLRKAMPDGDYEWEVPETRIWMIERNQKICDRIIFGLSR